MSRKLSIKDWMAIVLVGLSALLLALAAGDMSAPGDTVRAARRAQKVVEKRMALLDSYVHNGFKTLPEDMVIYEYFNDSLVAWHNQLPITNDYMTSGMMFQVLVNPMMNIQSPLLEIGPEPLYVNMGPKWYIARTYESGSTKTVAALEILNSENGDDYRNTNPRLHLSGSYAIHPLGDDGGTTVSLGGVPMFKVSYESMDRPGITGGSLIWAAFALFLAAALLFLDAGKSRRRLLISMTAIIAAVTAMYLWGRIAGEDWLIFSPSIYAGGPFLYSLGAVVTVNLAILLVSLCLFIDRKNIRSAIASSKHRPLHAAALILAILGILAYSFLALRDIILNSNISLELYYLEDLSWPTLVIYLSFLTMLLSVPVIMSLLHQGALSARSRVAYSALVAMCIVAFAATMGFGKERSRLEITANRLSIDRDIELELQLMWSEEQIAADMLISALAVMDNASTLIQNRIADFYLSRISREYRISVMVLNDNILQSSQQAGGGGPQGGPGGGRFAPPAVMMQRRFNSRLHGGVPIADNSRFRYISSGGRTRYDGVFYYYSEEYGMSRMLLEVEPRYGVGRSGYASLLGLNTVSHVDLPRRYSYARYHGDEIQISHGDYAYPTAMSPALHYTVYDKMESHSNSNGYVHFIYLPDENEAVVISRQTLSVFNYLVASVFIATIIFLLLSLLALCDKEREAIPEKSYFRKRLSWVIMTSLILTLVALAMVSVVFVYRRDDENRRKAMSDKINSIQAISQDELNRSITSPDMNGSLNVLERISALTGSDITLFSIDGHLMVSSAPEVYERMLLGSRISETAFDQIIRQHKRYYLEKDRFGRKSYYNMYAPIMNEDGEIVSILCSPYAEEGSDFEKDAIMHSITILTVFLILLLLARFLTKGMVERMFGPISEIGRKMSSSTDIDKLEYLRYDRDDEISTLVQSYNRMVTELSESTRKLAQAERDKAWSGMARQVAHEIKNPLTPMKLQIQRIIRLKDRNDPSWQDKFDEATKVLLDHIDILTETANEFSTFAKLYTEEPTQINLDKVLQEEISMFDNKENLRFDYYGLKDTVVSGPKPQLTLVFVNIINNAVQAVEEKADGHIIVSLRNSVKDGFYDIVIEDNGPGVSVENENRLFTPNFTTKNGGSGLGLAISKSILERCGATIGYSRSFSLGGACFTISYPRP